MFYEWRYTNMEKKVLKKQITASIEETNGAVKDQKNFLVKSSSTEKYYEVNVLLFENGLVNLHCSCPAGIYKSYCKHSMNLVIGNKDGVTSPLEPMEDIKIIQSWLKDSKIEKLIKDILSLDEELTSKKKVLANYKKKLGRLFTEPD